MKILYIGALDFGYRCLESILKNKFEVVGVYSLSEKHKERSGFKDFSDLCNKYKVPLTKLDHPKKDIDPEQVKKLNPDIILVIGWSWLISNEVISIPKLGSIGHHPTLLPKHKGNAPIPWTLIKGLTKTGTTFFYLEKEVDSGKIAGQKEVEVEFTDDALILYNKLADASIELLSEILPKIENGTLESKEQDPKESSFWPRRKPEDGIINWNSPSVNIYNLIRGVTHPYPGAFTYFKGKKLLIWESELNKGNFNGKNGEILEVSKDRLSIKTKDGIIVAKKFDFEGELKKGDVLGMNIAVIIQARMGSTRLPGKIMKEIQGKKILWHVVERVKRSKLINQITIATTDDPADNEIEDFCKENKIDCFRGDEENVLDRYYQAAKQNNAEMIVRVTSDCPLVDPGILDKLIHLFLNGNYDYVSNNMPPTYPHGLDAEVFSFSSLEKAWRESKLKEEREHVTPYIRKNPKKFKIGNLSNSKDLSKLRWTLDFKEDFELITKIYSLLGDKAKTHNFNWLDILQLFKLNPELYKINKDVKWNDTRLI